MLTTVIFVWLICVAIAALIRRRPQQEEQAAQGAAGDDRCQVQAM